MGKLKCIFKNTVAMLFGSEIRTSWPKLWRLQSPSGGAPHTGLHSILCYTHSVWNPPKLSHFSPKNKEAKSGLGHFFLSLVKWDCFQVIVIHCDGLPKCIFLLALLPYLKRLKTIAMVLVGCKPSSLVLAEKSLKDHKSPSSESKASLLQGLNK